jgi:hypothetical protein
VKSLALLAWCLIAALLLCSCGSRRASDWSASRGAAHGARPGTPASARKRPLAWWERYKPLSVAETARLVRDPSLSVGEIQEDGRIFASYYGYPASRGDARAIAATVKRYYALAAADKGKAACTMLLPSTASAASATFRSSTTQAPGTCEQVVSRLFELHRNELAAPIKIDGVLTRRARGYAVFHSTRAPASIASVIRMDGSWRVSAPLGGPIPAAK